MGTPKSIENEIEKIKKVMQYWIFHNNEHILEDERWLKSIYELGLKEVAAEIELSIHSIKDANNYIQLALEKLKNIKTQKDEKRLKKSESKAKPISYAVQEEYKDINFIQIGVIHTPYNDKAPYQPLENDDGDFNIVLYPEYTDGLYKLDSFNYIYVLYYINKVTRKPEMRVSPPWVAGSEVGLFASRSPVRPNQLGLSIVRLKKVVGNILYTSGLDVFDGTPLLDIKPYIKDLDSKSDANYGWIESEKDWEHLILHIKGIPHDY